MALAVAADCLRLRRCHRHHNRDRPPHVGADSPMGSKRNHIAAKDSHCSDPSDTGAADQDTASG